VCFSPGVFRSGQVVEDGQAPDKTSRSFFTCLIVRPGDHLTQKGRMQGVQGNESRPKPDASEMESESAQQMRTAGFHRAQAEEWQKKGFVEKLQTTTNNIKDATAEQMDKMGEALKNSSATSAEK
jgi:hypothetical protein